MKPRVSLHFCSSVHNKVLNIHIYVTRIKETGYHGIYDIEYKYSDSLVEGRLLSASFERRYEYMLLYFFRQIIKP